ncbi:MAG: SUMF1/EgtB/PvdO family nonheme iron enzyme [Verrucomicrobiota bacterium]
MKLLVIASTLLLTAPILSAAKEVDFVRDIAPIFEATCINCHGPKESEGDVRMDTKEAAFKANGFNPGVTPGDPDDSSLYWTTIEPRDSDLVMPPKKPFLEDYQSDLIKAWIEQGAEWPEGYVLEEKPRMNFKNNIQPLLVRGGPFSEKERYLLRLWTEQGAVWPEGMVIAEQKEETGPEDGIALVEKMREQILATTSESTTADMKEYSATVPSTGAKYSMVPIPGGEFLIGSPESEADRQENEGPQRKVTVEPFWMGKFEVTWDEYEPFMITDVARRKDGAPETIPSDAAPAFLVSKPTTPYTEMSFGMGTNGFPAISMSQHAALKYCQWLSAQTGHFYRLPTEAEWEYACRAGTTTAFHWGDDPGEADKYAWYWENSEEKYQKIGLKEPNQWGLHDMHGNVMEWCLDWYEDGAYAKIAAGALNPYNKPVYNKIYPRVARGGSWYDEPDYLRSAVRFSSSPGWKIRDPQLPKSIWYHTDAEWLGFRLVRPLKTPSAAEMQEIWNSGRGEENEQD